MALEARDDLCARQRKLWRQNCVIWTKRILRGRISNQISIEIDTFREMFFSYGIERTTIR